MARVFISYRHDDPDQTVATALSGRLNEAGHDVFFDAEDIRVGDLWDGKIGRKLEDAEYFIPLISASYFSREYILHKELKVAWRLFGEKKIRQILPVNIAYDGDPPPDVREAVRDVQHLKWRSEEDTERLCREIVKRLPAPEDLVKGMRAFVHADERLFAQLGREEEIAAFVSLLGDSRSPYVLLHGVSGAGKTSFLKAGVLPRLGDPPPAVAELTADADESFGALASADPPLIVLDQFEQSLIRFAGDAPECRAFEDAAEAWVAGRPGRRVIFCLRDEYRTPFDTMLPRVSRHAAAAHFALLPLRPDTAAHVLERLLDSAGAEYDREFLGRLCEDYLAEGVPKRVLPALLQMVAQYWRGRDRRLDKAAWERLTAPDSSLFEDHVRGAVLERLPRGVAPEAAQSLAALAEGEVKSRRKSAEEIAEDYRLGLDVVKRTLEVAALPSARVVAVETDAADARPRYRLIHDLFVPAVQALQRDARLARERRRRGLLVGVFALLAAVSTCAGALALWQSRVARRQGEIAVARQLAMQSNDLRASGSGGFMRSLLFAAESHRLFPTAESDASVRAALALAPLHVARLGHSTLLNAAPKFSRDGGMLVTGGWRGGVRVWDVGSRRPLADFDAGLRVNGVAFSREGAAVAAGAGSPDEEITNRRGVALAWDVRGGRELARADFNSSVTDVAFVGDTARVAAVAAESAKVFGGDGSPPLTIPLGGDVTATALSGEAGLLAVARGERVELYELSSGRLAFTFDLDAEIARHMAHVPAAGEAGRTLLSRSVLQLAFDAAGTRLAAAGGADAIVVWDIATRRPLATIKEHVERNSFLALSDDGALVAYTDFYGATRVWDVGDGGARVALIEPDTSAFTTTLIRVGTVFRPGSRDLFTPGVGSSARLHRVFGAQGGAGRGPGAFEVLKVMPGGRGITAPLAVSPDGRHVVTVGDGDADLWELKGGAAVAEAPEVYSAAFSPSGRYFAAQTKVGRVEVFDLEAGVVAASLATRKAGAEDLPAFTFGGERLAVLTGEADVIEIYDQSGRERSGRVECRGVVRAFTFAPGGREILFSLSDNSLWRADADGGAAAVEVVKGGEHTIRFSPGGGYFYRVLYLAGLGKTRPQLKLQVFETSGGSLVLETPLYAGGLEVEFSGDDGYLAAFTEGKTLTVWETAGWRVARRFDSEGALRSDVEFGGGDLLAVASSKDVDVWNVRTGESVARLRHESGSVTGVAFSRPDARHLLTTCRDGRARVWDLSSRAVVALVEGVNPDERPAFSPGGKHFMTVGRYNNGAGEGTRAQVTLWRPEDLRAEVCRRVTSNLTPEDWAQYTSYRPKEKVCPGLP